LVTFGNEKWQRWKIKNAGKNMGENFFSELLDIMFPRVNQGCFGSHILFPFATNVWQLPYFSCITSPKLSNFKNMKYIFITGRVMSSLGKGLTAGALAALLECHGYQAKLQKFDPYLNIDP
jgi:hypothetical protein